MFQNDLRNVFAMTCIDFPDFQWGNRTTPDCDWTCNQPCEPYPPQYDPMNIPNAPQWYIYFYGSSRQACERQIPFPAYTCNYCDYFCCQGELSYAAYGPLECDIYLHPAAQYLPKYEPPSSPGEFFTCETSNQKEHGM
jgi:hypothetical protein